MAGFNVLGYASAVTSMAHKRRRPAAASSPAPSLTPYVLGAGLVLITLAALWEVHRFGFVTFDDQVYVTKNPHVSAGITSAGIAWAFASGYAANWHPLTWISHMADVQMFGLEPGPAHVINLILHVANVLLVWLVLRRLTGSMHRSAVVAALFAVHPLHVESVAWIAERKDVLSTLFALLSLWAYAAYARNGRRAAYLGALFWFALGLMSKPMLVTLPVIMLLLDFWPLGRRAGWWPLIREKVPFLLLSAASATVTLLAQQRGGAVATLDATPFGLRVVNSCLAYVIYVGQTLWPSGLSAFYPLPEAVPVAAAIGALAVLAVTTWLAVRRLGTDPYLLVGWLWFLVMLVPVIGIIQIGAQAHADRYMYLPMVGLLLALVWGGADLAGRLHVNARVPGVITIVLVLGLANATRLQAAYWMDGISLWQHAVEVNPLNARGWTNLGTSLADAGRGSEAIAAYRRAIEIEPAVPQSQNNLGLALMKAGQTDDAVQHLREAVRLNPAYGEARNNLGNALIDQHRVDEAIEQYVEAVRLRPGDALMHNNLGAAYAQAGRMPEATAAFLEAARLEPSRADWQYAVGVAYAVQGDTTRASQYLREAVRLDPAHEGARRALAEIGR